MMIFLVIVAFVCIIIAGALQSSLKRERFYARAVKEIETKNKQNTFHIRID